MPMEEKKTRDQINQIIKYSPIIIVIACSLISILFTSFLGVYAYIPVLLIYWSILFVFILFKGNTKNMIKGWLQSAKGSKLWSMLPFLTVILTIPMVIMNWHFLTDGYILISLIIFTAINPWFEEFYWRGLLVDATKQWPLWLRLLYSGAFFTINHPLMIGIFSIANRMVIFLFTTMIFGVLYALVYVKTSSLRWLVLAHALVNFLGISTAVFLNYYIPEGLALW